MSCSFTFRALAGAALVTLAAAAQAGTLTMAGWLFGAGHNVAAGIPNYSGAAGGFKGALSGMNNPVFNLNPVEMYCIDLGQYITINNGTTYGVKIDGETNTTDFTIMNVENVFSAGVSNRLSHLVSYAESALSIVDTSAESTSLQLAIWNTVYESSSSDTLGLGGGTFTDTSIYAAYATTLLTNSLNFGSTKRLYVMRSATNQDQLFWIDSSGSRNHDVPEPASLALVALALGGAGLASRRRRG